MAISPRRQEVLEVLREMRRGYVKGNLKPYEEHLADDVVVLGIGDERVHLGKERALDYLRVSQQKGWMRDVKAEVKSVRFIDSLALVVETYTTDYMVKGESFRSMGRATSVLRGEGEHWYLTHVHLETLATNRVS